MKANIGTIDRLTLGLFILALGYYFQSWWGLIGFGPVLTAVFRFCPAYLPFGLNTCGTDKGNQPPAA